MQSYKSVFFAFLIGMLFNTNVLGQINNPPAGPIYDDQALPRLDIFLPADSLDWILTPGNEWSNHEFRASFIFDNGTTVDTVQDVGFRLRGNTSRSSDKKSFKVSMNTFVPGRKFYGVEKLNLNGEHNDPTISRAKICWDIARDIGIPSARANHVLLYINNAFFGVYANIEHIDEEFVKKRFGNNGGNLYKCIYPADLDYKGSDPDLYKEVFWGRRAYQLKTNKSTDDYSDFAHFIDILNNSSTADLPCELEKVFNVDAYLKAIAFDVLTGNWDGPIYNKNNFYLYHNTATNLFEYIPYDLDNTLGIDWLGKDWGTRNMYTWSQTNQERPLYNRIMSIPEYKNRYSYYMDQITQAVFNETFLFPKIDALQANIEPWIPLDTYYPLDYGFSFSDFLNSFTSTLPYSQTPYGLKPFITTRRNNSISQTQLNDIAPIINNIHNNHPSTSEEILISAQVEDDQVVTGLTICYYVDDPNTQICTAMLDDGLSNDGTAGDGVYGIVLPAWGQNGLFHYFLEATDNNNQISTSPICGSRILYIGSTSIPIAINEFMASNVATIADNEGEYDDWIELYNYGTDAVFLGDKYLSDDPNFPNQWSLPEVWIDGGEYLIFWADDDTDQGDNHCNFKLSANGEYIGIFDNTAIGYALIDGLDFQVQEADVSFGRLPNGQGDFQTLYPSPGQSNYFLGTGKGNEKNGLIISTPNPFDRFLQIIVGAITPSNSTIEILDITGKSLYRETHFLQEGSSLLIDTTNWPAGIYFTKVSQNGQTITYQKLIK